MLNHSIVVVATMVNFAGSVSYARDTLRGLSKPNRVTWALWAFVPLLMFSLQVSHRVGWSATLTLAVGVGPALVVVASLFGVRGYWRIGPFDVICGGTSLLAVAIWLVAGSGDAAIGITIVADLMAGLPTILKAYHHPDTETPTTYITGLVAALLTLLAIETRTFAAYAFPAYLLISGCVLSGLILFPAARFPSLRRRDPHRMSRRPAGGVVIVQTPRGVFTGGKVSKRKPAASGSNVGR